MTNVLDALKDDFKLFLQALWEQLDLPSPTRAQYHIADYLQMVLNDYRFKPSEESVSLGLLVHLYYGPYSKIMRRKSWLSLHLKNVQTTWVSSYKN